MAKYYRQYKVSGVVKFCDNRALGEDLEDAKKVALYDLFGTLEAAHNHGTLELVELSEIEDLGLSDVEMD